MAVCTFSQPTVALAATQIQVIIPARRKKQASKEIMHVFFQLPKKRSNKSCVSQSCINRSRSFESFTVAPLRQREVQEQTRKSPFQAADSLRGVFDVICR